MDQSSLLNALVGAVVYGAGASFVAWRQWRSVKGEDNNFAQSQQLVEVYKQLASDAEAATDKIKLRLETVEQERNALVGEVSELRASVIVLTSEVKALSDSCIKLEAENKLLQNTLDSQTEAMQRMEGYLKTLMEKKDGKE